MMKIESGKEIYVNKPNDVRNLDLLHIMTAYWLIKENTIKESNNLSWGQ